MQVKCPVQKKEDPIADCKAGFTVSELRSVSIFHVSFPIRSTRACCPYYCGLHTPTQTSNKHGQISSAILWGPKA